MPLWKAIFPWILSLAFLVAVATLGRSVLISIDGDSAHPVASNATVERRIHLVVDTQWDNDHRKKFECREVTP
jgi:adenosine/AMP kinase